MSESITSGQKKQLLRFFEDAIDGLQLSKGDAQRIIECGDEFQSNIVAMIRSTHVQTPVRLLELVTVVDVSDVGRFVAEERFTRENGYWLSEEAKKKLLPIVSEAAPAGKVRIVRLTRGSVDEPTKVELGDRAEISIAQFVGALQLGHEVIGNVVIAYLKELPGLTVCAYWRGAVWRLRVFSVTSPSEWFAGCRVLSGDSESKSL